MPSLLRTEAIARAGIVRPTQMTVQLDLRNRDTFASITTINFDADAQSTFVDFKPLEFVGATLNGRLLDPAVFASERIQLDGLQDHNTLVVEGVMAYSNSGEGLHQSIDPLDGNAYLYGMSFLDAAPRWFACFDQPDLKAPYRFLVTTPPDWVLVGNGPAHQLDRGRWEIAATKPLATYFVSLSAGPYHQLTRVHDGITLGILAKASLSAELDREAEDIFRVTASSFDAYHRFFKLRYQFGEYHQIFVPDFNAGAMENPGCVTFRDQYLLRGTPTRQERASRAGTIAHEMAHQWFGDLVTMKWWDDLWLNESFAEYMGHRITTDACGYELWTEFGINRKFWGATADQSPSSHPVAVKDSPDAQTALANFDGISYAKGASVLRQLVTSIGDEAFFRGLNDYFAAHAFGNATFADLIAAWENAGGVGVGEFAAQWLETKGMDKLIATQDSSGWLIEQQPPDEISQRRHTIECAVLSDTGVVVGATRVQTAVGSTRVDAPAGAMLIPDATDATWARIRPSDDWNWPQVSAIVDSATRVVLYNAVRDGVRSGELSSARALRLVISGLLAEPNDAVLANMGTFAVELAGPYAQFSEREAARDKVSQLFSRMLATAEAGSDRQLVLWRLLVSCLDDPALLTDWLNGTDLPLNADHTPRSPDQELRWAIVTRLMLLGGDQRLIGAELERDNSTSGQDAAAGARAAIDSEDAKEAALGLILHSDARAYELYAVAEHLFAPEQFELCYPLALRWFAEINQTAEFRAGWALARVARLSFPVAMGTPELVELANQTLVSELDERVRRVLVDGTDLLARVVRAQG